MVIVKTPCSNSASAFSPLTEPGKPTKKFVPILGGRVKELRQKLGWNGAELARRSHLRRTTILSYETGRDNIAGTDFVEKLAAALGVSPDYLTGAADDP